MSIHLRMSKQASNNPSGFWKMILLLFIIGAAALMISPVSADTGVTIAASGDLSYYQGEKVVFSGRNYDSDTTYLFIEGPEIPGNGGKLTTPRQGKIILSWSTRWLTTGPTLWSAGIMSVT